MRFNGQRGVTLGAAAVLVAVTLLGGGCGTILGGTSTISLNTNPPGAAAYVNGRYVGRTPVQVQLSTDRSHRVAFSARGYVPVQRTLVRSINVGWLLLDILWFPVGVIVDAITGKWGYFPESYISVQLQPAGHQHAPTNVPAPGQFSRPPGNALPPPATPTSPNAPPPPPAF